MISHKVFYNLLSTTDGLICRPVRFLCNFLLEHKNSFCALNSEKSLISYLNNDEEYRCWFGLGDFWYGMSMVLGW